jgi:polyhydroxyalkanoate synthesis regulator phasin
MKMKERNAQLKNALGAMASMERVQEVASIPAEDTVNRQGFKAYSLADELRLLSMLNTLKIADQYYRSEDEILVELRDLVERIGLKDPYFLAQCIVYSRCCGEGMRSINQLAATLAAPFVAGQPWAKAFYSLWDKKRKMGGCIYRVDDMEAIKDAYVALNSSKLSNAMKKGFANALENLDTYQLAKYKKACIDLANLVHPNSALSKAVVNIDGEEMKTLDALMKGITVSADTWEVAQSEAGQEVAKAVKEGKITKEEGEKVLAEAKNDNWESLLMEGRLGILAALRNIRNMLKNPRVEVIDKLCELVSDGDKIRDGLVMPYHLDLAHVIIATEFANCEFGDMV